MDLKILENTPPWEWPEDAAQYFLKILGDDQAAESDRCLAAELAGDYTVFKETAVCTDAFQVIAFYINISYE